MPRQAGLACENHIVLQNGATSETYLSHDQAALPNAYVVSHLHQIVDLRTGAHHSITDAASVDSAVCAYLDIVLQVASANVR
jgi:hypothetical protein